MTDVKFMQLALMAAKKALPECLPNPPVGCVLVKDGGVVSEGYTRRPGHYHAEVDAMDKIKGSLKEYELYVILEPCSFQGRTPSCAQAILERGIRKVYVGIIDPHPRNQGAGIAILEKGGVNVEVGALAENIAEWLSPYLYSR